MSLTLTIIFQSRNWCVRAKSADVDLSDVFDLSNGTNIEQYLHKTFASPILRKFRSTINGAKITASQ